MTKLIGNRDLLSGILLLVIAGAFGFGGRRYEFGTLDMMGPGFVPLSLAGLLAVLGLAKVVIGLAKSAENGEALFASFALKPTILVLGAIALFGALMPIFGYLVASALLVIIAGLAAPDYRLREVVISAVLIAAATGLIFVELLGLPMPLLPRGF